MRIPDPSPLFHDAFHAAISGDAEAIRAWSPLGAADLAGLAVYRNTIAGARADVLIGAYPTVSQVVGEDWMQQAALAFTRQMPGDEPALHLYGAAFADWLAAFPPAQDLPYLASLARLDRAWSEAHAAPDAKGLTPDDLRDQPTAAIMAMHLIVHPSVRIFRFDWSTPALWLAHRKPADPHADMAWVARDEAILIHRPEAVVQAQILVLSAHTFLKACRRGATLADANLAALRVDPGCNLNALFSDLLTTGVFNRISSENTP